MPITEVKLSALGAWAMSGYPMLLRHLRRAVTQDQLPSATSSDKSNTPLENMQEGGVGRRGGSEGR